MGSGRDISDLIHCCCVRYQHMVKIVSYGYEIEATFDRILHSISSEEENSSDFVVLFATIKEFLDGGL